MSRTSARWRTRAPVWPRSTSSTSKVPAELKTEVDALKADIIGGKIKVKSGFTS